MLIALGPMPLLVSLTEAQRWGVADTRLARAFATLQIACGFAVFVVMVPWTGRTHRVRRLVVFAAMLLSCWVEALAQAALLLPFFRRLFRLVERVIGVLLTPLALEALAG